MHDLDKGTHERAMVAGIERYGEVNGRDMLRDMPRLVICQVKGWATHGEKENGCRYCMRYF